MQAFSLSRCLALAALALGLVAPGAASAHNGVKLEQDSCIVKAGPAAMHFIAYQRKGEEEEFCDDIALTGPTVMAINPVSEQFRDHAIGVQIVKDQGGGVESVVATIEPKVRRNGVLTFEHDFVDAGRYVAIVSVGDGKGGVWTGRFAFAVGLFSVWGSIEHILYGVGFLGLVGLLWYMLTKASEREGSRKPAGA